MMAERVGFVAAGTDLADLLAGFVDGADVRSLPVTGVSLDSRRLRPGEVFLAMPGTDGHGLDHIDEAIHRGASAILYDAPDRAHELRLVELSSFMVVCRVEDLRARAGRIAARFHGHPSRRLTVYGITGTNGKTSCSHYLAQASTALGRPCAALGTLGLVRPEDFDRPEIADGQRTTPDAATLQALLASLETEGVAMEVSSHGLDQGRVGGVEFSTAIFTNLGRDHLDYHGDLDAYGRAKARLFSMPGLEQAVLNADDAFSRRILATIGAETEVLVHTLAGDVDDAFHRASGLRGRILESRPDGTRVSVESDWGRETFLVPLLGRFNVSNVLAVLGALLMRSVPLASACAALEGLRPVPGRMECHDLPSGGRAVVDYAHTPEALALVLETLGTHCAGRLICVFGCGGDRDPGKRPLMGAIAERLADRVVLTDDNPRREDPAAIVEDILSGMADRGRALVVHDRARAIGIALGQASRGDVVLIAGKGHETRQWSGGRSLDWDDRRFVRRWIEKEELRS